MLLVVAMKSRTYSSFPYPAHEQACRAGREHSQADSPGWTMEIFHTMDIALSLWMGAGQGARICSFTFPWVWVFYWPGVWTSQGVQSYSMSLASYSIFVSSRKPAGSEIAAPPLPAARSSGGEKKIVLCIVCFAYSLLLFLLLLLVFPLLPH